MNFEALSRIVDRGDVGQPREPLAVRALDHDLVVVGSARLERQGHPAILGRKRMALS